MLRHFKACRDSEVQLAASTACEALVKLCLLGDTQDALKMMSRHRNELLKAGHWLRGWTDRLESSFPKIEEPNH